MRKDIIMWIMYLLIYINERFGGKYEVILIPIILVGGYYLISKNLQDTKNYIFGIIGLMLIIWLLPEITLLYIIIVVGYKNKFNFMDYVTFFFTLFLSLLLIITIGLIGEGVNNLFTVNLISVNGLVIIFILIVIDLNKKIIEKLNKKDDRIINLTIKGMIIVMYVISILLAVTSKSSYNDLSMHMVNIIILTIISVGLILIFMLVTVNWDKKNIEENDKFSLSFIILGIIVGIYVVMNLIYLIPGNKVEINNVEDFQNIKYNSEVVINKDIDFQNRELEINTLLPFGGSINGNGKELSNIKDEGAVVETMNSLGNINNVKIVNSTFRNVVDTNYGKVDKIRVENSKITGNREVGVVGSNNGTISRVSMDDKTEVTGDNKVGGIAGINTGSIKDSYNAGIVKGNKEIGGIAGINNGPIETTYYTGLVQVDKEDEAEYIGNIAGKQVKNELSLKNVGSEVGVFYDPVYFRENAKENSKYGYSYDDILGQPYNITQSYIKYRDSIDTSMMKYIKDNPSVTGEELKNEIEKQGKEYFDKLNEKEKKLVKKGNGTNNNWNINENNTNSLIYADKEYKYVDNSLNKDLKKNFQLSVEELKIVEKYFIKETLKNTIEEKQAQTPKEANTKQHSRSIFYIEGNLRSDYYYNKDIWNLDNLTPGSSEPIKLK